MSKHLGIVFRVGNLLGMKMSRIAVVMMDQRLLQMPDLTVDHGDLMDRPFVVHPAMSEEP